MVPDSLTQACREGVQAEIENGVMYDRLLAMTVSYGEVQQVFSQSAASVSAQSFTGIPAVRSKGKFHPD